MKFKTYQHQLVRPLSYLQEAAEYEMVANFAFHFPVKNCMKHDNCEVMLENKIKTSQKNLYILIIANHILCVLNVSYICHILMHIIHRFSVKKAQNILSVKYLFNFRNP